MAGPAAQACSACLQQQPARLRSQRVASGRQSHEPLQNATKRGYLRHAALGVLGSRGRATRWVVRAVRQAWLAEGFLDALGSRCADALVDRECLPQVRGGLASVAVGEVTVADSFQGACFLWDRADLARDRERLGVLVA